MASNDSKKQLQEDLELDSGFVSSSGVIDPVRAFLDKSESDTIEEKSESSQPIPITEENKSYSAKTTDNSKNIDNSSKDTEMDLASYDSGMISTNLTTDLSNLTLDQRPEQQTKATGNEVYFQINEEGDT